MLIIYDLFLYCCPKHLSDQISGLKYHIFSNWPKFHFQYLRFMYYSIPLLPQVCIIQYNNQWECMSIKSPYDGNCVAFWFYVGAYQSVSNNAFHQISKFSEGWSLSLAKLILSLPVRFCFNRCFVHLALNGENQHNPIQFISWSHNERLNRNVWTYYTLYINNMVCWISPVPH